MDLSFSSTLSWLASDASVAWGVHKTKRVALANERDFQSEATVDVDVDVGPYLDVLVHPDQRLFQGVKAGRVEHFSLDPGGVRTPGHEEQLLLLARLGGPLALVVVLEVEQAVAALALASLGQVVEELDERPEGPL